MNSNMVATLFFLFFIGLSGCNENQILSEQTDTTIVDKWGRLTTDGNKIVDQNQNEVVLRGMSLFWSNWGGFYYAAETIKWLKEDWKCTVIRAAIGADADNGYIENPGTEMTKLYAVIDACLEQGIYVIVDWHSHHAEDYVPAAVNFFNTVSKKYGGYPNIIYEIYNEPLDVSWANILKPYAETLISIIRQNDPENLILVGTPNWSQDVDAVIADPLTDHNVAYTLHFYTSTHTQWLRDKALTAMNAGLPLFVSEWGLSESSGTGDINWAETNLWLFFLERDSLSWCNWSVINKDESSAALLPTTSGLSGWPEDELTESGQFIRNYLRMKNRSHFGETE